MFGVVTLKQPTVRILGRNFAVVIESSSLSLSDEYERKCSVDFENLASRLTVREYERSMIL